MFNKNGLEDFLKMVEGFGSNNAFCIADKYYVYTDFLRYISKIRTAVQLSNNKSVDIGLVANDDIENHASIFAIWLEGFAYIPLHPHQPFKRSLEIISQADIGLVIN